MMFSLTKPNDKSLNAQVEAATKQPAPDLGLPKAPAVSAPGYHIDHAEYRLGTGLAAFESARSALTQWRHYDQSWIRVCPSAPAIRRGTSFVVAAWAFGAWSVNQCRIIDLVDDAGPVRRFGFVYRTLPSHVERGDAMFVLEHRPADDSVWLIVHTVSRMNHWLSRLFTPLGRIAQRRARDAAARTLRDFASDQNS
jgi:uncharacterized protein (UPF0548 family)